MANPVADAFLSFRSTWSNTASKSGTPRQWSSWPRRWCWKRGRPTARGQRQL